MFFAQRVIVHNRLLEKPLQVLLLLQFKGLHHAPQIDHLVVEHVSCILKATFLDLLHALVDPVLVVGENLVNCHDIWKHIEAMLSAVGCQGSILFFFALGILQEF